MLMPQSTGGVPLCDSELSINTTSGWLVGNRFGPGGQGAPRTCVHLWLRNLTPRCVVHVSGTTRWANCHSIARSVAWRPIMAGDTALPKALGALG
jgi:hypothetical protein